MTVSFFLASLRFLMIEEHERLEIREIRIVQNWHDEVERLLAATED